MAAKKFGTFGGVFTPSILTILGVIMYMRLGWVVGNAGLYGTMIIIGIAHIISVSTGLSISSIATDKKVGAGGVYYVLSRSLGLPIGGAIGVTLWVATALSIALYLVGFAESFNAYIGLDTGIPSLRIAGTVALAMLATIAIISTAVAIKTQYFIMAAIVISIVSILAGTWEFAPATVPLFGREGSVPMETIFAIFFPAVTGFTAGIAMSGDLADPKKSIPAGTIAAIIVGLVVYAGLAVFIAFSINPDLLVGDYNILMKVAFFAPAVVAGIWGATLSSALGGILGGPRILQAMSIDRITPRLFGKGVGKDNEPRNALLVTLVIAECGVLIGELDMIARVCSMFYLAAYGFINLSFYLESWASADFSPSFKVKRWIGLVGFIATFAVMFKLDMGAMIASFVVIGGIYLFLQRKQLALSSGDVWTSVWSSLVMKGLHKMDSAAKNGQNWTPNILMFSGGMEARPHLIEMSKVIAGKAGMVSNFDLIENPQADVLFPKNRQAVQDPVLQEHGIFGRKQEVQNVFKGIEAIASTYGFSGVEPNTVMLGWAKNTKDPIWFAQMTQKLITLDYNVLFLDYDPNRKFGKYQRIDIWWQNLQNNAELTLNLVKYISRSNEWRQAKIRVVLINNTSKEGFERRIHKMLDTYRIEATVKVINNHLAQHSSYDLMKSESQQADLILAGIPEIPEGEEKDFVENTTEMFESIATTLLVKTSSRLGEDIIAPEQDRSEVPDLVRIEQVPPLVPLPTLKDNSAQTEFAKLSTPIDQTFAEIVPDELMSFQNIYESVVQDCRKAANELVSKDEGATAEQIPVALLNEYHERLELFRSDDLPYLEERLSAMIEKLVALPTSTLPSLERKIMIGAKKARLRATAKDHFRREYLDLLEAMLKQIGYTGAQLSDLLKDGLLESEGVCSDSSLDTLATSDALKRCFDELLAQVQLRSQMLQRAAHNRGRQFILSIANQLQSDRERNKGYTGKEQKAKTAAITAYPAHWRRNEELFATRSATDLELHRVQLIIGQVGGQLQEEIGTAMFDVTRSRLSEADRWLNHRGPNGPSTATDVPEIDQILVYDDQRVQELIAVARTSGEAFPEQLELMESESTNDFLNVQGEDVGAVTIDPLTSFGLLMDENVQRPIQKHLLTTYQICMEVLSKVQFNMNQIAQHMSVSQQASSPGTLQEMASSARSNLQDLQKELEIKEHYLSEVLSDIVTTANSSMNTSALLEYAVRVVPKAKSTSDRTGIHKWIGETSEKAGALVNKYSDLIAENGDRANLSSTNGKGISPGLPDLHYALRRFTQALRPKAGIIAHIPFYYKQLFIGKQSPNVEQLLHRDKELAQALSVLHATHTQERNLLVLGVPQSGKTFFAGSIAKLVGGKGTIKVQAPINGSTSGHVLRRAVQKEIGTSTSGGHLFADIPKGALVWFDDLELWWERSDENNRALRLLVSAIATDAGAHQFLLGCNTYAFRIMEGQGLLDDLTASHVYMRDLDPISLRSLLLDRHATGGFRLQLNGGDDDDISRKDLRKLMDRCARNSKGVVGAALHQWISNITAISDDAIEVTIPVERSLPPFDDKEWLVILSQFVIHKQLDAKRLQRLFAFTDPGKAERVIKQLNADGLLRDVMGNTYELDPLVQVWVIERATGSGLV